jgi:hypothetical protein
LKNAAGLSFRVRLVPAVDHRLDAILLLSIIPDEEDEIAFPQLASVAVFGARLL